MQLLDIGAIAKTQLEGLAVLRLLSTAQLEELAIALLDFTTKADLEAWLERQ